MQRIGVHRQAVKGLEGQGRAMKLAMGAASFASRLLGAKKDEQAARVISTSFFLALCTGFLVLIFGNAFQVPLLRVLGARRAVRRLCHVR